mgnify:CR=1 FL=1
MLDIGCGLALVPEMFQKKYNTKFLEAENKRLKKVLEDISYSSEDLIAKVIIDKQSPFLRSIIICSLS